MAIAFLASAVLIHILNNRRQNSSSLSEEGAAPYVSVEEVGGTELR